MSTTPLLAQPLAVYYRDQFSRCADDAVFLWLLRSIAVNQPNYCLDDITALDRRIENQLDLMATAPELSWELCADASQTKEAGETFVMAVLAFKSLNAEKMQQAVAAGLSSEKALPGLISALGWLPGKFVHLWLSSALTNGDLNNKYVALSVCSVRREDPESSLTVILRNKESLQHQKLYARALRLAGELKRTDLAPLVRAAQRHDNQDIVFWAHWAAILLGDKSTVHALQTFVMQKNKQQARAIQLCFRILSLEEARAWISKLTADATNVREALTAVAVLGDPFAINWLLGKMQTPALSRLAGEAFATITGIDLTAGGLTIKASSLNENQLVNNDVDDSDTDFSDDERLPFPDVTAITNVWREIQHQFAPGHRYLMGQTITVDNLTTLYAQGNQRIRRACALEFALLPQTRVLLNHAAKGFVDA